jgi:hypothetical protein
VDFLQISELPPHTLLYEPEEHVEIGGQVEEGEEGRGRLLDTQDPYKGPPAKELWHLRNILLKFQYQNSMVAAASKATDSNYRNAPIHRQLKKTTTSLQDLQSIMYISVAKLAISEQIKYFSDEMFKNCGSRGAYPDSHVMLISVADPCCLFRIPISPSRIPIKKIPDPGSGFA